MISLKASRRNVLKAALLGMAGMVALSPSGASAQETLRVAHSSNPGQSTYIYWDNLARVVNEANNGEIRLQVYPSGQLGGDEQIQRSLKSGIVHMGSSASANLGIVTNAYLWTDLPYVFKSRDHAHELLSDPRIVEYLDKKLRDDAGTKLLGHIDVGGFRLLINTKRQVKTPDEMRGMKLRMTASPVDQELISVWGGVPTAMPWSETFVSMEQGVVDGAQLQPQAIYGFGFNKIINHATHTKTLMSFHVPQVNAAVWDRLSDNSRELLMKASVEALQLANDADARDELEFIEKTKDTVDYYMPTDDELAKWREPALTVWDKFSTKIDPEILAIIKRQ
jgi:tripartite ATP-independent transporter DctP family solute receptor